MTPQPHLAENALALHLPLQHLKGLVDIVVADEDLHSAFLFDRVIDGTDGLGARAAGYADIHDSVADGVKDRAQLATGVDVEIVPADGHPLAANWNKRRLRYVAVSGQLFRRVNVRTNT